MNDNETKKALECCAGKDGERFCWDCPCKNAETVKEYCDYKMLKSALDLINRLEAENDELFETADYRLEQILKLEDNLKTAKAENEILQAKIDGVQEANAILRNNNEIAINNAIKEFAERLKEKGIKVIGYNTFDKIIPSNEIDNLLKELVGEDK